MHDRPTYKYMGLVELRRTQGKNHPNVKNKKSFKNHNRKKKETRQTVVVKLRQPLIFLMFTKFRFYTLKSFFHQLTPLYSTKEWNKILAQWFPSWTFLAKLHWKVLEMSYFLRLVKLCPLYSLFQDGRSGKDRTN